MTDGIPLIHADDRIGASGMQPKSPFAPPPPTIVPPSDGIGLQAAAGRKPVAMRAVPIHDQLADKVSKLDISADIWGMEKHPFSECLLKRIHPHHRPILNDKH